MKQKDVIAIRRISRKIMFHQFSRWPERINLSDQSPEVFNDLLPSMGKSGCLRYSVSRNHSCQHDSGLSARQ